MVVGWAAAVAGEPVCVRVSAGAQGHGAVAPRGGVPDQMQLHEAGSLAPRSSETVR